MGSSLNSGLFVRNKMTGQLGVTTVDPYGICAPGEAAITFATETEEHKLGNGFPVTDWDVVQDSTLTAAEKRHFAWARTAVSRDS